MAMIDAALTAAVRDLIVPGLARLQIPVDAIVKWADELGRDALA
jgi:hypothetical protein